MSTFLRCHPLAGWSFTFLAICCLGRQVAANVRLHGASPWHPKSLLSQVATIVRLHGASPWHPKVRRGLPLLRRNRGPKDEGDDFRSDWRYRSADTRTSNRRRSRCHSSRAEAEETVPEGTNRHS